MKSVIAVGASPRASSGVGSGVAVELDELLAPDAAENGTVQRVTVQIGETVLLPCKAYSLGQRTVSTSSLSSRSHTFKSGLKTRRHSKLVASRSTCLAFVDGGAG